MRGWERRCWAARGGNEADPYQREVEKESRRWRERGGSGSAVEAGGEGGVAALLQSAGTRTTTASAVKTPTTPPTSPQPSTFNGTSNTSNGATGTFTTTNSTGSSTTNGGVERMRDDLPDARSAAGLLEPKDEAVHYHPRRRSSSSGSSSSNCRTMMSGTTRWPSTSTGAAIPGAGARAGGAADQGNEKEKEESEEAGGERAAGASAADDRSAAAGASHGAGRRGSSAAHADTAVSASGGPGGVLQRPKGGSAPRQESGGGRPTVQQKSDRWTALEVRGGRGSRYGSSEYVLLKILSRYTYVHATGIIYIASSTGVVVVGVVLLNGRTYWTLRREFFLGSPGPPPSLSPLCYDYCCLSWLFSHVCSVYGVRLFVCSETTPVLVNSFCRRGTPLEQLLNN